jgi:hypothetical protein
MALQVTLAVGEVAPPFVKRLEHTLREDEEHVDGIPHQEGKCQGRDGGSLVMVKLLNRPTIAPPMAAPETRINMRRGHIVTITEDVPEQAEEQSAGFTTEQELRRIGTASPMKRGLIADRTGRENAIISTGKEQVG